VSAAAKPLRKRRRKREAIERRATLKRCRSELERLVDDARRHGGAEKAIAILLRAGR
jgi:hypothetical protein